MDLDDMEQNSEQIRGLHRQILSLQAKRDAIGNKKYLAGLKLQYCGKFVKDMFANDTYPYIWDIYDVDEYYNDNRLDIGENFNYLPKFPALVFRLKGRL